MIKNILMAVIRFCTRWVGAELTDDDRRNLMVINAMCGDSQKKTLHKLKILWGINQSSLNRN